MEDLYYCAGGMKIEPYQDNFFGVDSEEQYNFNKQNAESLLEMYGWKEMPNGEYPYNEENPSDSDTVKLSYRYNSHGFRGVEMPEASAPRTLLTLGSNMAFGMGMPESLSWPALVGSKVGHRAIVLATPNSSLESQYRLLMAWLPRLRSTTVVLQEQYDQHEAWERTELNGEFISESLPGDTKPLAKIRRDMVLRAMQSLCDQFKVQYIHIPPELGRESKDIDYGRDLMSPGRKCHRYIAYQVMKKMGVMN